MLLQTLGYIYLFKLEFSPDTWAVIELLNHITIFSDLLGSSDGKKFVCSIGDLGLIPWLGRAPGERNNHPHQISCLENLRDRGAWQDIVYSHKKSDIRSNEVALIVNKRFWIALLGYNFKSDRIHYKLKKKKRKKSDRIITFCFQGKPFNITEIQIHAPTTNA